MNILQRARDIILNPRVTWQEIKEESTDIKQLFINYAAPLALIPAIGKMIGYTLVGFRHPSGVVIRAPFLGMLVGGITGYVLGLGGVLLVAWIVKLLASPFNSKSDLVSAVKLIVYSITPFWLAGIFSIVPGLQILSLLGLYGFYLLFLGLPAVLETPRKKVILYIFTIIAISFFVGLIFQFLVGGLLYGPMFLQMMAV